MASLEMLRQLWGDVLGIDPSQIGDNDNFMDCMSPQKLPAGSWSRLTDMATSEVGGDSVSSKTSSERNGSAHLL